MLRQIFLELLFVVQNFVNTARLKSSLQLTPCHTLYLPYSVYCTHFTVQTKLQSTIVKDGLFLILFWATGSRVYTDMCIIYRVCSTNMCIKYTILYQILNTIDELDDSNIPKIGDETENPNHRAPFSQTPRCQLSGGSSGSQNISACFRIFWGDKILLKTIEINKNFATKSIINV